jgi:hypothetical protein
MVDLTLVMKGFAFETVWEERRTHKDALEQLLKPRD